MKDGTTGGTLPHPNGPITATWQAQSGSFSGSNWGGATYYTGTSSIRPAGNVALRTSKQMVR